MSVQIKGIENMSVDELNRELERGGKFVIFDYCFSILVMTFKRSSDIYFIKGGEGTFSKSFGLTFLSLIAGWWGIPWGPITISSVFTNLSGGRDVTKEILASFNSSAGK